MFKLITTTNEKITSTLAQEIKNSKTGLAVLFAKPYRSIEKSVGKCANSFEFIDAAGNQGADNVIPVPIKSLTALSMTIYDTLQTLEPSKRNVILDSPGFLNIYNNPELVKRFLLFTIEKLREVKADMTIVIGDDEECKRLIPILTQTADKVIKQAQ